MIKRRFLPTLKKAGVQNFKFSDLRDNYAILLIMQNLPLTYIQKQLGHSSPQVTNDRYKSLIPNTRINTLNLI